MPADSRNRDHAESGGDPREATGGIAPAARSSRWLILVVALLVFLLSLAVRIYFFSGFILGDDGEEFLMTKHISHYGADFQVYRHLEYRFAIWLFNVLCFKWLGATEMSFFLPTVLMSASLSAIGYFLLLAFGHGVGRAALGSLLIATAPFEVLIGTLRANDLILAWFLALALFAFLGLDRRPALQGVTLATLFWLAFYTKLWALFLLPALGVHYLVRIVRYREWRGAVAFALCSSALHAAASFVWKLGMGTYLPFLTEYSATYPVASGDLLRVFQQYPSLLLRGSEFGTTLFGAVPYLLILLLAIKIVSSLRLEETRRVPVLDRVDVVLIVSYVSFFLLLNFLPMNFVFDRYYSVPRIFRYMTPISFPMVLHVAKLLLDLWERQGHRHRSAFVALFSLLILVNLAQAAEATSPGRTYHQSLHAILSDIERDCPPQVLVGTRLGIILKHAYLQDSCPETPVLPNLPQHSVEKHEAWLRENESALPDGTLLVTGLASYVHYGCHRCGFRLEQFRVPLASHWVLVGEYDPQSYLPVPERARLWRLSRTGSAPQR